jgi:dihydroorotate dehydrogenase electron transfer subunit
MLSVAPGRDPLLRRPFGIHDFVQVGEEEARMKILYQVCGQGTSLMTGMKPGEPLDLLGPLGRGFSYRTGQGDTAVLAGGIGGAPLLYLVRRMKEDGLQPVIYAGGNSATEILGASEFHALGLSFREATMDGSRGYRGSVVDLLLEEVEDEGKLTIYACGPWAMMEKIAGISRERGWSMQGTVDSHMACGMGLCLGCAVEKSQPSSDRKYLMVCREGPVFDLEEIKWTPPGPSVNVETGPAIQGE